MDKQKREKEKGREANKPTGSGGEGSRRERFNGDFFVWKTKGTI